MRQQSLKQEKTPQQELLTSSRTKEVDCCLFDRVTAAIFVSLVQQLCRKKAFLVSFWIFIFVMLLHYMCNIHENVNFGFVPIFGNVNKGRGKRLKQLK